MAPALSVNAISKHHGPVAALRGVSLTVERGTVHGLVGGNGAGKSTLVKILAGVSRADPGGTLAVGDRVVAADHVTATWSTAAGLRFVHQDLGVFLDMTVAENLAIGRGYDAAGVRPIRWGALRANAAGLLARFGIAADPQQTLGELGAPDRTLVAIARALQDTEPDHPGILVLDEPTACLPHAEAERLLDTVRGLADQGHAIVLIGHRLGEIVRYADTVSVLRDGTLVRTVGRDELTEQTLIELISGESTAGGWQSRPPAGDRTGTPVLEVRGLCAGPLQDISLDVRPGEILGIAGLLGSGRSRLLRALYGVERIASGEVRIDGRSVQLTGVPAAIAAGVAYVPQDRVGEAVFADMTVGENLAANRLRAYFRSGLLRRSAEAGEVADMISRYGIRVHSDQQVMATLSGGNQQKAVMARVVERAPRVLLLDEPSQGVDVRARAEIHRIVRRYVDAGSAAVVVSSDFEELGAVSDRVMGIHRGRISGWLTRDELTNANLHQAAFRTAEETR